MEERLISELKVTENVDLKVILENSLDMISITDAGGFFLYVTPSHKTVLGYEKGEMLGRHILDFIHPEDAEAVGREFLKAVSSHDIGEKRRIECRYRHRSGQYIFLEIEGKVFANERENRRTAIFNSRDISERKEKEIALEQSEERYKKLIEFLPEAVYIQVDRKNVFSNKAGLKLLNIDKPDELKGRDVSELIHPDYRNIYKSRCEEIEKQGCTPVSETKIIKFDGQPIDVESSSCSIMYEGKTAVLSVIRDITQRKQSEKIQKQKELYLKQITDNTIYMIVRADLKGTYEYVTPSVRNILGYEQEYMIGKNVFDFVHPDDYEPIMKEYIDMFKSAKIKKVKFRYRTADGSYIWMEVEGKPLYEDCRIVGAVYSIRDITKQVLAEELLMASEEKYRRLVELMPDAVYIRTKDTILYANNLAARYFNIEKPEDLVGRKISELIKIDEDFNKEVREKNFRELFRTGVMPLTEQKFTLKNGRKLYVETTCRHFPVDGQDAWLVVSRDISDKKQLSEKIREKTKQLNDALEYDKLRSEFIANVSHELRTPVNVILSALQMTDFIVKGKQADDDISSIGKYLGMMRQNSYRLIRLVNNLIDVTKADSGYMKLNPVNCNIVNIVEDITMSVVEYAKNKGLTLIFDTNVEEEIIACDPDIIERILLNLLSNSIKFTPSGGTIKVKLKEKKKYLELSVKDTGIGIPPDKQKQIFERFAQVDKSLSRNCEGSGIGLSLVKSLVRLHQGDISLKSKFGKGSEFIITIPLRTLKEPDDIKIFNYSSESKIEKINIEFSDIYI